MTRFLALMCLCFLCGCSFMDRMWDTLAFWRESGPAETAIASSETEAPRGEATIKAEITRLEDQRRALDERIAGLKMALNETNPPSEAVKTAEAPAPIPAAPAPAAASAPAAPSSTAPDLFSDLKQYSVHLASYRGVTAAARGWQELKQKLGKELNDLEPRVVAVDFNDGRGTFYRLKAGPFADKHAAAQRCDVIKASGNYCHVEDFTGQSLGGKS